MPTNAELHSALSRLDEKIDSLRGRVSELTDTIAVVTGELNVTREQVATDLTKIVGEVQKIKNNNPYRP